MPASITSAEHADISLFSLLVGAYENCAYAISYLLDYPSTGDIFVPDIKEPGLLCDPYPFEDGPEQKEITHHHTQEQSEFPWDAYPVCCCNHISQPRSGR